MTIHSSNPFPVLRSKMGWAIAIQGGAGEIPLSLPPERRLPREACLRHCLQLGVDAICSNKSALDVVELVVRELEKDPHYNAGRGSVLTSKGTVEMEACIMDDTKRCGAVMGLSTVVNPISLARLVMEKTPHIYLGFGAAEEFAREQGVETVEPDQLITKDNIERLTQFKVANQLQVDHNNNALIENGEVGSHLGTVGCVVIDTNGRMASATSTGGCFNKMAGRVGDTPIVGSGTYANSICAVSATGNGECIIRATVARDVAALMEYKGLSLKEAAEYVVGNAPKGKVGLVAVSSNGEMVMRFNTLGMYRACATQDGYSQVAIH